jgi:hypothetical protein
MAQEVREEFGVAGIVLVMHLAVGSNRDATMVNNPVNLSTFSGS